VVAGAPPRTGRNGVDRTIALDPERVRGLVGMDIAKARQIEILRALGFTVANPKAKRLSVAAPSWRPDVRGEADLVEEIARVVSLAALEGAPFGRPAPGALAPPLSPAQRRSRAARRALAELGLNECVTYSFVSEAEAAPFGGAKAALENPIASDKSHMRPSLLPGLLAAAARNQARGFGDLALFELGPVFHGAEPGEQSEVAACLRVGASEPRGWTGGRRAVDLYDAKADAEAALAAIGAPVEKLQSVRDAGPWMHPGRSARLKLGPKTVLAEFGELHPSVLAAFDVKGPAMAAVIHLENAPPPKAKGPARPALTLHDLQTVERDFAFVVDARVEAETVLRAARGAEKKLIAGVAVFDVFDGPKAAAQLGAGKKSLAISVTLQPVGKSLTDEEIDAVAAKVVAAVEKAAGARLRA
ncbi:MAG: phenylalanine--tRNA ligase subunit beta, partial [Pseudomonadota bacterium]